MTIQTATNPQTGERVALVNGQWLPVGQTATNDKGQKAFLVNNQWLTDDITAPPVKEAGFSLRDIAKSFGIGAVGSTKALTDVAGAENLVSSKLGQGVESLQQSLTPERQAELQRQAARMKAAEESGSTLQEIKAGALNVAEAPLQSAAQAVGSFVPYLPALFASPLATAIGLTGRALSVITSVAQQAPKIIGTAQGAGAVKGSIYDGVLKAEIEAGVDPEVAKQKADAAQSYFGGNFDQIALGAGLGYVAGSKGVEELFSKAGRAGAAPGMARRVGESVLKESVPEGAQGGQEKVAENIALQREGYDVDTFKGVAGAATQEALTGALGAAPIAAMVRPEVKPPEAVDTFEKEKEEFRKGFGKAEPVAPTAEAPVAPAPEPVEPPTQFPGGYTATRRELSRQDVPESFGIFAQGSDKPLTTVTSQEEVDRKLQTLTEIRQEEQARLLQESDKISKSIQDEQRKLEVMEATGQTDTDQYVQAKTLLSQKEEEAALKLQDINDKIASYSAPLSFAPIGSRVDVQNEFVVNRGDQPVGVFPTLERAEATLREREPEVFKQAEVTARTQELESKLKPMLAKFNLGDVGLNVVEQLKNNAGGAYLNRLIQVSLDEDKPIQTMRHESMHALKDLGFFTPQQWKALTEQANGKWIKEYLQDQTSEVEVDGKPVTMSRLDAYKQIGLTQEEIIEEAISDAFGAYDRGATPPPGMIAALFKKLKNFFMNFGQALRGAGFESSEDIFQRVERGELKSRKPTKKAAAKPEEEAQETAEKLSLKTVEDVIKDGVDRLVKTARKGRIKEDQDRFMVGYARADTNLNTVQDGIEKRLMELGVSTKRDERGDRELDAVIYGKVLPAYRAKLKELEGVRFGEEEFNARGFENVGKKKDAKYSLAGEGIPMSTRKLMEQQTAVSQQELGLNTDAVRGRFNNVREIAKALNQQTLDQIGAMDRNNLTQDESTRIAEAIVDEVAYQLGTSAQTGTGLGWYSNNYPNAVKRLGKRFPELSTSKHARSIFSALVAVTSNGERVAKNIDNAIKLYSKLRSGKRLVAMGNRRPTALQSNLQVIQDLLVEHGQDFEKALLKEITVKEMNARLREMGEETDGSYLANTVVPAAAVYFGPKLGAFYANLSGSEGYLTMDLWWTRSINRMRGLLMPKATEASINKFRNMMDRPDATRDEVVAATVPLRDKYEEYGWTTELEHLAGAKEPAKKAAKEAWFKNAEEKAGDAYEQLLFEHNLEKMANTIYKNEFEMLEEAPFTATDRKFMYDAARKAQTLLRGEGINLSLADIQAALWYYEKRLYAKLSGRKADDIGYEEAIIAQANQGSGRARPSVVFDQKPDGRDERGPEVAVSEEAGELDGEKLSLRKGIVAEVAPNPDHISAEKWREMTPSERLNATKAVANRVVSSVFSELGLKGYKYEFSTGTYEGEINPNIIVQAPDEATEQELDELGRVLGYVLDQKAMVVFDEDNKTSGDQAGFVKVVVPDGMTVEQLGELRQHIAQNVPQADGDTLRDGELVYGNFSAYNDKVDTLSDAQYHKAIRDAIETFPYDGVIDVSAPETFHSSFIWPDTRSDYLKETRYGDSKRFQGEAGADVRGQRSRRLQAISEDAISLRDKWIDARGAARLGGRERGNAVDFGKPTEEYGTPTRGSVSVVGVHFSRERRPTLISEFHGAGLRGLESERLNEKENSDIRGRVYFYVDNGKGIRPEAGVGGTPHVIQLKNLYDTKEDSLEIIKNAKGNSSAERASNWERNVKRAGFDGYLVKNQAASQDYAVLIGKHSVETGKYSLKNVAFPSVKAAKEAVSKTKVPNTEEFKRFIAGSQWTDSEGKPKTFYHATAREFFEFTPAGQSQAIFLADTPEEAETFGSIAEDRLRREIYKALTKDEKLNFFQGIVDDQVASDSMTERQGSDFMRQAKRKVPEYGDFGDIEQETYDALLDLSPTRMSIMPLYARAETPFEFENADHVEQVMQWVANNTSFPQDFPDKWLAGMKGRISQGLWQAIEDKRVQQAIRALGHDSFTVRENRNSPKNYAVYKPEQVKSITGNLGEYSRESKDMRFSLKKVRYSDGRFDKLWNESMYTQNDAENKTKGYLAFVNPMEFVRATTSPETFERLRREQEPLDVERMKAYDQVPFLTVSEKNGDWKITGHEGRHRMLALYEDGYREVPVYIHLRSEDAKSIPVKALTAERADAMSSVLMAAEVEPLSYANKQKAMEKFIRMESKVKYSLPKIPEVADERINETTSRREEKKFFARMVDAITPGSSAQFRQRYLNRYNQMSVYDKKLAEQMGGSALLADQSAESAALMSDLGAGIAASAMGLGDRHGGIPVLRNGITTIDRKVKGMIAALAPLAAYGDPKVYQRYQYWAMVKRGQRLNKEGKLTGIDSADVAFAKMLEQKHPEFVSVQKDLIAFNNGLVKYMVDTGVLSQERASIYTKHADYIPFYRQMDGETTLGPNLFQSLSGVKPPKKLKGAIAEEAPLADFLETMVRNTQSAIQAGVKNYAGQRAVNVASQVKAAGMGVERLNTKENGPNIINVLEKGNLVSYRTADHLLMDAVGSLNLTELPFMGILSAPADLLRNLVTKDPGFMMANLMRDSLSAWVTSGQKMTPIAGTVINFGKALTRNSPGFEAMQDAGIIGGYEFSANIEQSGRKLEEDLAKKAGKKDPILFRPFTSVWSALETGTTASDAATRALIYERVLADTGNEAEALYRSLEVMNFHRKGNSPLIRVLTAAVPFFNARLQGLDLFYRASTGNMNTKDAAAIQRQFWARGATMMALSAAYWFMVSDDEEYKKQEQETKDNNWLIPGLGIRIPIPFEVGVLFKVIPERIVAYTFGNDTGKDLTDSLKRNAISTFAFNPIPQTAKPIVEAAFDFNTFTWRPIIGKGMEDVAPEFQVGPSTSNVAKLIGQNLGLSPMKVDHVIKGYTGTMGMYLIDTVDMVLDQFGNSPKPTKRFEQLPVIKRFALDAEARGYVTQYYELKDAVDTTVRTMNLLEKTGESDEYMKYLTKNQGTLAFKDYIRDTEKVMKDLRDMRVAVRSSQMTGDEKRDALLEISKAESGVTSQIQLIKKTIASVQ
jgi:hypothetical protein